jgi:hypothetical protein
VASLAIENTASDDAIASIYISIVTVEESACVIPLADGNRRGHYLLSCCGH